MSGFGFPPQNAAGMSEMQQQSYEQRQAAAQRVGAQAFQTSWYQLLQVRNFDAQFIQNYYVRGWRYIISVFHVLTA